MKNKKINNQKIETDDETNAENKVELLDVIV